MRDCVASAFCPLVQSNEGGEVSIVTLRKKSSRVVMGVIRVYS